jgi:hypothetical protein
MVSFIACKTLLDTRCRVSGESGGVDDQDVRDATTTIESSALAPLMRKLVFALHERTFERSSLESQEHYYQVRLTWNGITYYGL